MLVADPLFPRDRRGHKRSTDPLKKCRRRQNNGKEMRAIERRDRKYRERERDCYKSWSDRSVRQSKQIVKWFTGMWAQREREKVAFRLFSFSLSRFRPMREGGKRQKGKRSNGYPQTKKSWVEEKSCRENARGEIVFFFSSLRCKEPFFVKREERGKSIIFPFFSTHFSSH